MFYLSDGIKMNYRNNFQTILFKDLSVCYKINDLNEPSVHVFKKQKKNQVNELFFIRM